MASEEKMKEKILKYEQKLKANGADLRELKSNNGKIPAIVAPFIAGGTAYASGYADGMLGTADNKHPASISASVLGIATTVVAAVSGHPSIGQGAAAAASGPIGFLSGSSGYEAGAAMKLRNAANKAAPAAG